MPTTFGQLINIFLDLIRTAIPVLVGVALLVFLWGLAKFIFRIGGDEKAVSEGRNLIVWGLIAIFVMVSVWGIIEFVSKDIGFTHTFGLPFLPVK